MNSCLCDEKEKGRRESTFNLISRDAVFSVLSQQLTKFNFKGAAAFDFGCAIVLICKRKLTTEEGGGMNADKTARI